MIGTKSRTASLLPGFFPVMSRSVSFGASHPFSADVAM
jgi:hypothetical protein